MYYQNHTLCIPTFLPAVLSCLFKCKFLHHRLKAVTAMSEFHPCGGTRHLIWDKWFTACERESRRKAENHEWQKPSSWRDAVSHAQIFQLDWTNTDLVGEDDTGLPVAEFHSQLSASLRLRPCTHTLRSQSRHRRRLRPSVCTLCHCHLTTDN